MTAIWTCTIGSLTFDREQLPSGCDLPMRRAVEAVAEDLGLTDVFVFSGWGQNYLDESHLAVVEGRDVRSDPAHEGAWLKARQIIEDLVIQGPADISDRRTETAISVMGELIFHLGRGAAS